MNDQILPVPRLSPQELLFGMKFTWLVHPPTADENLTDATADEAETTFALSDIIRADAHVCTLKEAEQKANTNNDKVHPVTYEVGDLVQFYHAKMDLSHESINKIAPKWLRPHIITGKFLNSYSICTLTGEAVKGMNHPKLLKHFIPRRGSDLDLLNLNIERQDTTPAEEDEEQVRQEAEDRMGETKDTEGVEDGDIHE